jgi:hypothetical protein
MMFSLAPLIFWRKDWSMLAAVRSSFVLFEVMILEVGVAFLVSWIWACVWVVVMIAMMDMIERSNVLVNGIGWDLVYKYKWFEDVVDWVVNIEEGLGNFLGVLRKEAKMAKGVEGFVTQGRWGRRGKMFFLRRCSDEKAAWCRQ